MARRWSDIPIRLATGAFILNSGVTKLSADAETAGTLHGFASGTYPFLGTLDAKTFTRALAVGELALGTALLAPVVPAALAGAGLAAFSAGLLGLYVKTPGMRNGIRPTQQGIPIAKDVWMLGIGLTLMAEGSTPD